MSIYTKTGDGGQTSLFGGPRRSKSDRRVFAYGEVDELQAALGVIMSLQPYSRIAEIIAQVQQDGFVIGAELARVKKTESTDPKIGEDRVVWLESQIDALDVELPELKNFIVQGGSPVGAHLHLARAVCRRAERAVVSLQEQEEVSAVLLKYINRLSDLLFVLARWANQAEKMPEQTWKNPVVPKKEG